MPSVNLIISEADYRKLRDDYDKVCTAWLQQGRNGEPPPFEHWAGSRLMGATPVSADEISHARMFAAIEQLVTSLQVHGFSLTHVAGQGTAPEKSAQALAQSLVRHFELAPQYLKRLQDVFVYFQKSAASLLDDGQGRVVLHAATALETAFDELQDRTTRALDHLETERAIGRIEGAIALLVSLDVINRDAAKEKTQAFKSLARGRKKS